MKDYDEMTDDERCEVARKAMIWCVGMLHELESHGLVNGDDGQRLTPKGVADFDQLKASGWRPPEDLALAVLKEIGGDNAHMLWKMISKWCEGQR
jgi:hypothetical protein